MKIDTTSVEFGMALCFGLSYLVLLIGFIYMNIVERLSGRKFLKTNPKNDNKQSNEQLLLNTRC